MNLDACHKHSAPKNESKMLQRFLKYKVMKSVREGIYLPSNFVLIWMQVIYDIFRKATSYPGSKNSVKCQSSCEFGFTDANWEKLD